MPTLPFKKKIRQQGGPVGLPVQETPRGGILEEQMWTRKANTESLRRLKRNFWQRVHHVVGHSLVGLSNGQLWAWAFHDWSWRKAWPESDEPLPQRWKGLE